MATRDTLAEALALAAPATAVTEVRPPRHEIVPLADVEPGRRVEFVGFDRALDRGFREQLLAYGLQHRQVIEVLQQVPMTVVVCDHVELALEPAVARLVEVRERNRG